MARGNIVGIIIGVLPGAGADMAAWVSYAMSKRFSKEPEKFGTGHPEGLIEAGASNNASLASGWVPSLLFGIPGDTITAIAIGVLYMKGLNPGPTLFTERASSMYALYIIFIIANIIMIPLGIVMIRMAQLRAARAALGGHAGDRAVLRGRLLRDRQQPVRRRHASPPSASSATSWRTTAIRSPRMVLGIVMGTMVEQSFVTSLIKSDGSILPFFERPVSAVLAAMTIAALLWPVFVWVWRKLKGDAPAAASAR